LAFAFLSAKFFTVYLISIAVFGLYQTLFMANVSGSWDIAKKVVEVDLREKGTPLHAADPASNTTTWIGMVFLVIGLIFVYRSFYGMRIRSGQESAPPVNPLTRSNCKSCRRLLLWRRGLVGSTKESGN
jgi:K(+)-stimulated pyrophosphate-energized sodium pump